jgi:hypothetical protein
VLLSVFWFWSAEGLQTEMVCRNLSARRPFPKWRYADHWRLIHDFDRQSVTWLAAIQQAGIFVFHLISPVTNGTISSSSAAGRQRSRLSFGNRIIWPRAGDRWCGVFQVVKTAQSRGRTERPLLTLDFCLHKPPRGALHGQPGQAEHCGKTESVTFDVTLPLAITESSF